MDPRIACRKREDNQSSGIEKAIGTRTTHGKFVKEIITHCDAAKFAGKCPLLNCLPQMHAEYCCHFATVRFGKHVEGNILKKTMQIQSIVCKTNLFEFL